MDLLRAVPGSVTVPSSTGRPRCVRRLMKSLLDLKHSFNLREEELVARWSENVGWQYYFSGQEYYESKLPCDATQIGRFRAAIGDAGVVEEILKATVDTAVTMKGIKAVEFERVIADTTVQSKAVAHPTDSRLVEAARRALVNAARTVGIGLKQTFAKEGHHLRWKAGRYGHARQFQRFTKVARRQGTIVSWLLRETGRKAETIDTTAERFERFSDLLQRCERIRTQEKKTKGKLYALHAPEVECVARGEAPMPYEFGVKAAVMVTHRSGLMVGARTFPGNPYGGHILAVQIEQTNILLEARGREVKRVFAHLGFRGVDGANPGIEITHRGKLIRLAKQQRKWLQRRAAVKYAIGHAKSDCGMDRCWLRGATGDALHAVLCAAGYNILWLLWAIARLGLKALYLRLILAALLRRLQSVDGRAAMCPVIQGPMLVGN